MKMLIAGWAGTGKSTTALALQDQNLPALDSDEVTGLSNWRDKQTGKIVEVDYSQPLNFDRLDWYWAPDVMEQVLAEHEDLFFCGNAANLWDFVDRFDAFFAFTIDEETQQYRLTHRENSIYGKEPSVLQFTIAAQQRFAERAIKAGPIPLDATQPISKIVEQLAAVSLSISEGQ